MALVFNTKTYTANSYEKDVVGYIGAAKTITTKDDLALTRGQPHVSATFSGQSKAEAKLTRTLSLTDAKTPTGDIIVKTQVYAPVGAAGADIDTALNDHGALISGADFKSVVKSQKISF